MKRQTFLQVVLLLILAGVIFYIVFPKYEFKYETDTGMLSRSNKITGDYCLYDTGKRTDKQGNPVGQRGWVILK